MAFQSLEQRMLQSYLDTFPPFVPARTGEVSEAAQEQLHALMEGMYRAWVRDPSFWFSELHEDDAHPNRFNKGSYGKPKLIVAMRKVLKTVDGFLDLLFALGAEGRLSGTALVLEPSRKIPRKQRAVLEALGFRLEGLELSHPGYPEMFAAWRWMATRPGASALSFSRCLFDPEYPYTSDVFRRLSGDPEAFDALEAYLMRSGYRRVDCHDGRMGWDYVKCQGDPGADIGHFVFGRHYIGVRAEYEPVVRTPQCFGLRILRMREILPRFHEMDDDLKDFVIRYNPKCRGCGFCTQRNRSRAPAAKRWHTTVEHRGRQHNLCPLFPGFSYCWTSLDQERVKGITAFLTFMERKLFTPREAPAAA